MLLRKGAALCLAFGLFVTLRWVVSEGNEADALSRIWEAMCDGTRGFGIVPASSGATQDADAGADGGGSGAADEDRGGQECTDGLDLDDHVGVFSSPSPAGDESRVSAIGGIFGDRADQANVQSATDGVPLRVPAVKPQCCRPGARPALGKEIRDTLSGRTRRGAGAEVASLNPVFGSRSTPVVQSRHFQDPCGQ